MKKIAIIMINYKDYAQRFLKEAVDSLNVQTYPKDRYQLFIVDNSSSEESYKLIKQLAPNSRIIRNLGEEINNGNNGYAKANNQAFKEAINDGFEYVVASNMDVVFEKDWLLNLSCTADSYERAGAVQAKILIHERKNKLNSSGNKIHYLGFGYCEDYDKNQYDINDGKKINYASGCSVLYKTEALKKVGLYEEDYFMYHEDTDLSWRLWEAGYEVILSPKATVWHKYEFSRSMGQFYFMERNRFLTIATNYETKTLILIFPALLAMEIGLFLFSIKNNLWKSKIKVYMYLINPINIYKIHKNRKIKQSKRVVKDRDFVKNFTGKLDFQEVDNVILSKIANPIFNFYWKMVKKII